MEAKLQLQEVREDLAKLDPNNRDHLVEIDRLKKKEIELINQVAAEEAAVQQHEERVSQAVAEFDDIIESMDFGGLTLAQIVGGASECQLIKIEIKKYIQAQADAFSKQIADLQTEAIAQRRAAEERETELQTQNENLQKQLFQATLNLQDMTNNRDAAAKELSEAKQEVERLNNHIDDLRKEIAVGARAAINVIDTEEQERQKKELADKIRKERTIYNKEYVDPIKKSRLKAKLAISGEVIEFPWTEENKYFVIDETEVQPFRDEYGAVPAIEAETVAETDEAGVTPEQFQARSPEVPAVWVPSVEPAQQVVRRTVEERLEALEKAVFGQTQDVA